MSPEAEIMRPAGHACSGFHLHGRSGHVQSQNQRSGFRSHEHYVSAVLELARSRHGEKFAFGYADGPAMAMDRLDDPQALTLSSPARIAALAWSSGPCPAPRIDDAPSPSR